MVFNRLMCKEKYGRRWIYLFQTHIEAFVQISDKNERKEEK